MKVNEADLFRFYLGHFFGANLSLKEGEMRVIRFAIFSGLRGQRVFYDLFHPLADFLLFTVDDAPS
jgi:hypothetical protein